MVNESIKINYLIMMGCIFGAAGIISNFFIQNISMTIIATVLFVVCCLIGIYYNSNKEE